MTPAKKTMVACLRDLAAHLAHANELVRTGLSAHYSVLEAPLFFFLARQFAFFATPPQPDPKLASLLLVRLLRCLHA